MSDSIILVDLDGTLIDFKAIDDIIILKIFRNNRIVKFVNNILWKINLLDFFPNNGLIFSARMLIYNIFSKNSFFQTMVIYGELYEKYANESIINQYAKFDLLKERGYKIIVITQNMYCAKKFDINIVSTSNKLKYVKKNFDKENIKYVIGNNYHDDIKMAYNINAKAIYIGNSSLVKKILRKNSYNVCSIQEAVNVILKDIDENNYNKKD